METVKQAIEKGAVEALRKQNPELLSQIETAIKRDKLTPKKIDAYVKYRFGLEKGNPVREMIYMAAQYISRTT